MSAQYPIDGSRDALWMATAVEAPVTVSLKSSITCDVSIIGAGITGLSAALHLASQGNSVCVIDAVAPGFGASGRSGGQVNMGLNLGPSALINKFGPTIGERLVQTVINTPNEFFQLIRDHKLNCDAVQNGWIQSAIKPQQMENLSDQCHEYQQHGAAVEMLDSAELAERTGTTSYLGGIHCHDAGSVQPLSYTRELVRVAQQKGAAVYSDSPVTGLDQLGDNWKLTTPEGSVTSPNVHVCTNGYTDALVSGLKEKVVPVRSILIATEPLSENLRKSVLPNQLTFVDKRRLILYFRYDRDGRLCVGDHGPMRDAFRTDDYSSLKDRVKKVFPQLAGTGWDYHWGGRVAMTRDSLPFLYKIAPGLTAGMGYNGRGVGMGTVMGRVLADHVSGIVDSELDFPVTVPNRYLFHRFHRPGVSMAIKWLELREHLDAIK